MLFCLGLSDSTLLFNNSICCMHSEYTTGTYHVAARHNFVQSTVRYQFTNGSTRASCFIEHVYRNRRVRSGFNVAGCWYINCRPNSYLSLHSNLTLTLHPEYYIILITRSYTAESTRRRVTCTLVHLLLRWLQLCEFSYTWQCNVATRLKCGCCVADVMCVECDWNAS